MRRSWKHWALVLGSLGLTIPAALAEVGVTDKEILVSTLNGFTGPNEFYGHCTNVGVDALFKAVNDEGGIYGRKIRCIHEDDKYDPAQAIVCFKEAMSRGVFGFTGLSGTPTLAKYLPMCMSNRVPILGSYSAPLFAYEPVRRYFFGTRCSYRDEMISAVDHLWSDVGARRIAVIYQNDAFGADLLDGVKTALKNHNADIVAAGSYTRNLNNVSDAVTMVKNENPDAVIVAGVHQAAAQLLKIAHDSNWHPIFVLNSACGIDKLMEEAGNDSDGQPISESAPPYMRSDLKLVSDYRKAMEKYFPDEKLNFVNLKGYIDAQVFVEGLKRTGKDLTRERFVDTLEHMKNVDLGMGTGMELNYSASDHRGFHKLFWMTTRNGQLIALDPWKKLALKK